MAVLKRGDTPKTLLLDSSRRFAASFSMAWNIWTSHFKAFSRLNWQACVLAGVIGVVWLVIHGHSTYLLKLDAWEVLLNCVTGSLLLFVMSMMRVRQLRFLHTLTDEKPEEIKGFFASFVKVAKKTWRPFVPLCLAWLVVYLLLLLPSVFYVGMVVKWILLIVAIVLPFPVAGMMQSYMEVYQDRRLLHNSFFAKLGKGFSLNARYLGGMMTMWLLSAVLMAMLIFVLFFGAVILTSAIDNRDIAEYLQESVDMPAYVEIIRYVAVFLAMVIAMFFQGLWSLPQQIHIYSIITKDNDYARRKSVLRDRRG